MKKYLLTALLGVFGLFGFVSANTVSCTVNEDGDCLYGNDLYQYEIFSSTPGNYISFSNFAGNCAYQVEFYGDDDNSETYSFSSNSSYLIPSFTIGIILEPTEYSPDEGTVCSFDYSYTSSGGGDSGDFGDSSDFSSSSQILSGGISQLSPVITSISSVMSEFIPYVVYIGIGILLVTLGFKAIKRLVNWLSSKITRYFK